MHPEDAPHPYPHIYFVPQTCGHVLEFRCAAVCAPGEFAPILGEQCAWCAATEAGYDHVPDEFRSKWKGGTLIRKSPFTVVELKELALIEERAKQDAADPPTK